MTEKVMPDKGVTGRKYFLDWLRVFAFGLLIIFHVGLMYASWGYVFKSPRITPDIEWILVIFSPWRIILLFFISGVACRFLMGKLAPGAFLKDRIVRLVPVILIGMFVINPVQNYIELLTEGVIDSGYLKFWFGSYLTSESFPGRLFPTWDHLWFLVYLFVYILALAIFYALLPAVFKEPGKRRIPVSFLVVAPALWLVVGNYLVSEVRPSTFDLVGDWAVHFRSAGFFVFGVLCAFREDFWEWCRARRLALLAWSSGLLVLHAAHRVLSIAEAFEPTVYVITRNLETGLYGWSMILTLAGFAAHYLDRSSKALSYLTVAVLPIYVLHQPVMIFSAWHLFPVELPLFLEGALLIAITGAGSLAIYEVAIRRFNTVRFAFGLKRQ